MSLLKREKYGPVLGRVLQRNRTRRWFVSFTLCVKKEKKTYFVDLACAIVEAC